MVFTIRLLIRRHGTGSSFCLRSMLSARQNSDALLAGKLFDDRGNRMSPSHAAKGGRRWRYYVSQPVLQGRKHEAGSIARVPALEIEAFGVIANALAAAASAARTCASRSFGVDERSRPTETMRMHILCWPPLSRSLADSKMRIPRREAEQINVV
jgi:hypothetical protein